MATYFFFVVCHPGAAEPFCCQIKTDTLYDPIATFSSFNRTGMNLKVG